MNKTKSDLIRDLGHGGSVVEFKTKHGVIREEILKHGLHDVIYGQSHCLTCGDAYV